MSGYQRPSPAFACPVCPSCSAPAGICDNPDIEAGQIVCTACHHRWFGCPSELDQARVADLAFAALVAVAEVLHVG